MIILSWNCRGLGNPQTVQDLCRMVKEKKLDMVFLMETKMRTKKMESVRDRVGFSSMFAVDCVGKSGGLGLFWGEGVKVEVQNFSHRNINAIICHSTTNELWKFTGFYGHPNTQKRHEAWELLKHLARLDPLPCMCIGDFNEVANGTEKVGGNVRQNGLMQAFQQTLEECELFDLGYCGPKYTWNNGQEGMVFVKERLDRGVANQEWKNLFPDAVVNVKAAITSDHAPLFLHLIKRAHSKRRQKRFRYEAKWAMEEGFKETITMAWNKPITQATGWDLLDRKLQICVNEVNMWRNNSKTPQPAHLQHLRERLAELQGSKNMNSTKIRSLRWEIQKLMEMEGIRWRQRAKVDWLKFGDRNTKFFHSYANSRRKKNHIEWIKDGMGQWCSSSNEVGKAFVSFFSSLFSAGQAGDLNPCIQKLEPCISEDMNRVLTEEFTAEEISTALHQMGPLKAPGPDGLNACFFQKNWALMGEEVCSGILHILNSGQMPHALNLTHIALIPKTKSPESVADFHPISLCNVLYKLVSKVLANRLKKILPFIISPSQSAFIPGCLISDNVLAAYETLHTMQTGMRGKKAFMAVKLDMSKAYDRVEWRFLEAVMRKMGFNERWIHLVMMCVSSAHYAILVNGEPRGHIFPTRGIRQGDPISPYLFLLCAEALSAMMTNANREGLLIGVSTSCGGPKISHLFFADDSLLFCRANLAQWSNMTVILKNYEEASGQKMNTNKTAIFFSKNTPKLIKETILEFAGIPESNSYDKYLGLPALVGRSHTQAFKSIIERV